VDITSAMDAAQQRLETMRTIALEDQRDD